MFILSYSVKYVRNRIQNKEKWFKRLLTAITLLEMSAIITLYIDMYEMM